MCIFWSIFWGCKAHVCCLGNHKATVWENRRGLLLVICCYVAVWEYFWVIVFVGCGITPYCLGDGLWSFANVWFAFGILLVMAAVHFAVIWPVICIWPSVMARFLPNGLFFTCSDTTTSSHSSLPSHPYNSEALII